MPTGFGLRPGAKAPDEPPTPYRLRASPRLYLTPRRPPPERENPPVPGLICDRSRTILAVPIQPEGHADTTTGAREDRRAWNAHPRLRLSAAPLRRNPAASVRRAADAGRSEQRRSVYLQFICAR